MRTWVVGLVACAALAVRETAPVVGQTDPVRPALEIVVVTGQDAVNILQPPRIVTPVIEVRDRDGKPVAGASVTFTVQRGAGTEGIRVRFAQTDAFGRAEPVALAPGFAGLFEIQVAATFRGERATATVRQTTWTTPDSISGETPAAIRRERVPAIADDGRPSLLSNKWLWAGIAGGGAAAAGMFYVANRNAAPQSGAITFSPTGGAIAGITTFMFSMGDAVDPDGDPLSYRWSFGDGANAAGQTATHVFPAPGTYIVTATVADDRQMSSATETPVTVLRAFTGFWGVVQDPVAQCSISMFFSQSGARVSALLTFALPCAASNNEDGGVSIPTVSLGATTYPTTITWDSQNFAFGTGGQATQVMRLVFSGTVTANGSDIPGTLTASMPGTPATATATVNFHR